MKNKIWYELKKICGVIFGACVVALSINYFIVPNRIVDGGVTGIAILLHYLVGLPTGWLVLALNIPVFVLGYHAMGRHFLFLSGLGVAVLALALELSTGVAPVTHNLLLATIYGGVLTGVGMGVIFRSQGSLGGTDIVALIIKNRFSINVGQVLLGFDVIIFLMSGLLLHKPDLAMYAAIYMFIATRVVDYVQEGLNHSKTVMIVSQRPEQIAQDIMLKLDRGVTFLHGTGAYSGEEKKIIYCVLARAELSRVKEIIQTNDPDAFVTFAEAPEVFGEGFAPVRGH